MDPTFVSVTPWFLFAGTDAEILKTVGQIAGIGGIALGVLLLIFRDILRKRHIFPKLETEHAYRLLRLMVILVWSIALIGLLVWAYSKTIENPGGAKEQIKEISGVVKDTQGNPIPNVNIYTTGRTESTQSTSSGNFFLKIKTDAERVRLEADKEKYVHWSEEVGIPHTGLIIELKRAAPDNPDQVAPKANSNPDVKGPGTNKAGKPSTRNGDNRSPKIIWQTVNRP